MKECPRCFWLTQHKVWKRPAGIFPQLPNGMDSILKKHFDRFMAKGLLPPEIKDHHHTEGLKLFDDKELLKDWRNSLNGGLWYDDADGNVLHGGIDNLLVNGKKLIVLDYKTKGFPIKNEDEAGSYSQNQLDIYNFILRKNGYETEDYAFLLFYVPKEVLESGEVVFDALLARRDIDVKNAENIFKESIKLLNSDCPKESCEWCEGR